MVIEPALLISVGLSLAIFHGVRTADLDGSFDLLDASSVGGATYTCPNYSDALKRLIEMKTWGLQCQAVTMVMPPETGAYPINLI